MKRIVMVALLGTALTACDSQPAAAPEAKAETPKTMVAGEYEVTSEVTKMVSTDKTTPATKLKKGDKLVTKACVAADGLPPADMFIEAGDSCTATNSYARSGRFSMQYQCKRPGHGALYPNADGNFTADSFEAIVVSSSTFAGTGDYDLTKKLTGKRVGDCAAPAAKG